MVVALGPGKFYGSTLPRPRFYTDLKFNDHRIDPPPSVMDPLMSWAEEAHWSMGGLSFKRHRLQGRIEGNVERLRAQRERLFKKPQKQKKSVRVTPVPSPKEGEDVAASPTPPPVAIKRRRVVGLVDDDDVEEEEVLPKKRGAVRKLGNVFERVAKESGMDYSRGGESGGAAAEMTESDSDDVGVAGAEVEVKMTKRPVKRARKIGAAMVAAVFGKRSSPRLLVRRGF